MRKKYKLYHSPPLVYSCCHSLSIKCSMIIIIVIIIIITTRRGRSDILRAPVVHLFSPTQPPFFSLPGLKPPPPSFVGPFTSPWMKKLASSAPWSSCIFVSRPSPASFHVVPAFRFLLCLLRALPPREQPPIPLWLRYFLLYSFSFILIYPVSSLFKF